MIPKSLHQIWIGPKPVPQEWVTGWEKSHPGWNYKLWREDDIETLSWHQPAYDTYQRYIKDERYCGAANVARAQILYEFGGVYIDADMKCLHTLNDAPFMRSRMWVSQSPHNPARTQNGAMAAEAGLELMSSYVKAQGRTTDIHPSWEKTGSVLFDAVCITHPETVVTVVPSPAFHPRTKIGGMNPARKSYRQKIYADHYFYSTRGGRKK